MTNENLKGFTEADQEKLNIAEVMKLTDFSELALCRFVKEGFFPLGYSSPEGEKWWYATEVIHWLKTNSKVKSLIRACQNKEKP